MVTFPKRDTITILKTEVKKMKKKLMSLFLAATMTCSMAAGATTVFAEENSDDTKEATEETVELAEPSADEGYTIGISVLNLTGQFFIQLVDAAQNEADATGCTLMTNSCDSDSAKQITALENFISAGCDAIIVCAVDSEAAKPVIAKAKEEGIAVVCLTLVLAGKNLLRKILLDISSNIKYNFPMHYRNVTKEIN